jgi:hypothetical protein
MPGAEVAKSTPGANTGGDKLVNERGAVSWLGNLKKITISCAIDYLKWQDFQASSDLVR